MACNSQIPENDTRWLFSKTSFTKNDVYAAEYFCWFFRGKLTHTLGKICSIYNDSLRRVRYRILRQPCGSCRKLHIPRGLHPCQIAGQWNTNRGRDSTPVQMVSQHDYHRSAKASLSLRVPEDRPTRFPPVQYLPLGLFQNSACRTGNKWVSLIIQLIDNLIHRLCDFIGDMPVKIFRKRLRIELATRFMRATCMTLCSVEYVIRY